MRRAIRWLAVALTAAACGGRAGDPGERAESADESPRVRLRLSGHLEGRLEPCGCAGGQLGGLARRAFLIEQDRTFDLLVEGGNLVEGATELDLHRMLTALTVLADTRSPYHALGLGARDLGLPLADLLDLSGGFGIPVVASDLVADGQPADGVDRAASIRAHVECAVGRHRVRIASLALAGPRDADATRHAIRLLAPQQAWSRALADCAAETLRVLLVHGPTDVARGAARLRPAPDLVVAVNQELPDPPSGWEIVDGVPLVHPGTRGRHLLDVTLTRRSGKPTITRYQPHALHGSRTVARGMEDARVAELLVAHRHRVRDAGLRSALAGRSPAPSGERFAGSESCAACHTREHEVWRSSAHARAWLTLERAEAGPRYGWPVTHQPDCVTCHATGYGLVSGFVSPEDTPDLAGVGCEACHGPGAGHAADPRNRRLGRVQDGACIVCHDFEQSPGFDHGARWKRIAH